MALNDAKQGLTDAPGKRATFEVASGQQAPASPAATGPSSAVQIGLFAFFTLSRTLHPMIIDTTKHLDKSGKKVYLYEAVSVPFAGCFVTIVVGQLLCLYFGGVSQWREIWRPRPMAVFSVLGVLYAIGDFLELKSMGSLSGPVFQVVSQMKLIITAGMLWAIKGQKQSLLQWILLGLLMLSLCCYMIMKDLLEKHRKVLQFGAPDAAAAASAGAGDMAFGVLMAALKVVFSCLNAVLSDKYMKDFNSEPIYMQLVQFKPAWMLTLWAITAIPPADALKKGMFHDWNGATVACLASFTIKGWSTLYLVAILDSMQKNIGEALTVLTCYFVAVFHPHFDDEYETETFITIVVVFLAVVAYLLAKQVSAKAAKYDKARGA